VELSPVTDSRTGKATYMKSPAVSTDNFSDKVNYNMSSRMGAIDEDETKTSIIEKFHQFMKIVTITKDVEATKKIVQRLMGDPTYSSCIKLNPENLDIFTDAALGNVEVDQADNNKITRRKGVDVKTADLVIIDNTLGSDTSGRRWLVST